MNKDIYLSLLQMLLLSVNKFSPGNEVLAEEIKEDFETIIESINISDWKANIDGDVKTGFKLTPLIKSSSLTQKIFRFPALLYLLWSMICILAFVLKA